MTCIIGFAHKGRVIIGGDSASIGDWVHQDEGCAKVFRLGPFVIGNSGEPICHQLLQYSFTPPKLPKAGAFRKYMVAEFIPALRDLYGKHKVEKIENGVANIMEHSSFLIGHGADLCRVCSSYQIQQSKDGILVLGCNHEVALGAMYALEGMHAKERVRRSLHIASRLSIGVKPPFVIMETNTARSSVE